MQMKLTVGFQVYRTWRWAGQHHHGAAVVIVDGGPNVTQSGRQRPFGHDVLTRTRVALFHQFQLNFSAAKVVH